jgi:hypothetical protein
MDWAEGSHLDPLPAIDFEADTCSLCASIHCPDNAMEDDLTPGAVSHFKDPDSGALPLSASISNLTPTQPPPKLEVAQLFDMIIARMVPMEKEIQCIAAKVDSKPTPTKSPPTGARPGKPLTQSPPTLSPSNWDLVANYTPPLGFMPSYEPAGSSLPTPPPQLGSTMTARTSLSYIQEWAAKP